MSLDDLMESNVTHEELEEVRAEFIKYIDKIDDTIEKLENALINQAIQLDLLQANLEKLVARK